AERLLRNRSDGAELANRRQRLGEAKRTSRCRNESEDDQNLLHMRVLLIANDDNVTTAGTRAPSAHWEEHPATGEHHRPVRGAGGPRPDRCQVTRVEIAGNEAGKFSPLLAGEQAPDLGHE